MQPAASPEDEKPFRPPHPLAAALIERLHGAVLPVLDFAAGHGRNSAALEKAGFRVARIDDATASSPAPFDGVRGPFAGAISTHGLLHGTTANIVANVRAIGELLAPGGPFYATFGSVRDSRFGKGKRIDAATYAAADGDERGVAHTFFDREGLTRFLETLFIIESLEEQSVDDVAGTSAHEKVPLSGAVHWFVRVRVS